MYAGMFSDHHWFSILRLMVAGLALTLTVTAGQEYTSIDYPGATQTLANGINDNGDIVGQFNSAGVLHGFLLKAGKFTQIDYPSATKTAAEGINSLGDVVGFYVDSAGQTHGFLLSKGTFTSLDYPKAATTPYAINTAGDVVGMIQITGKPMQGFLLSGGVWTALDYRPDTPSNTMSCYFGINDAGVAVGHWGTRAGGLHGVIYKKGVYSQIEVGAGGHSEAWGINSAGDIVGDFQDLTQGVHGFLMKGGHVTQIDYPGAPHTMAYGINVAGQIVGHYLDSKQVYHGFVAKVTPAAATPVIMVDDDGFDCPGAVRTIQEAVAQAPGGATILVCPGVYRGTVNIVGPEKANLKLIAVGRTGEVVLQGDYTERDGFHLENVTSVLVRGFTVRDFGNLPTNATQWGTGNQIYLENAHYNTIEQNVIINGDMMGFMLVDSGSNVVQNNVAWVNNSSLTNCGVHIQGAKSANNLVMQNLTYGNNMSGIMLSGAGPGNRIVDNLTTSNGRFGISNSGTDGTWIEGNRVSYNGGPWGTTPYPASVKGVGLGINVTNSTGVTVFDNRGRNNTGADINWDGNGQVKFEANACNTSTPAAQCENSTATSGAHQPPPEKP